MTTSAALTAFILGAAISLLTSWALVSRLERVGERLGLSEALLGVIAALAADAPEITSSISALIDRQGTVGVGVVIGSNVFNLAALLGLGAVVAGRIGLHRRVIVFAGAVAMWVALSCLLTVSGVIQAPGGSALVLGVLVPFALVLGGTRTVPKIARRWSGVRWLLSAVHDEELELEVAIRPPRASARDIVEAAIALCVVVGASVSMERGATSLGHRFGWSEVVVGGLVLAAVTSLPNAIAAVYLAAKGRGEAAFSTALNSNNLNVIAGLLLPGLVVGIDRASAATIDVAGWYVGLTLVTLVLCYSGRGLRRRGGAVIIAGYAAFVVTLLVVT